MESNVSEVIFLCSKCHQFLDLKSKTLPCLHSLCRSCLESHIEGAAFDNCNCPQCHEPVKVRDQLRLAPFLANSLRRRQLESNLEWWCDHCIEDRKKSIYQIWCYDCQKLFCQNCQNSHNRFLSKHKTKDLVGMTRDDAITVIMTDECRLHDKSKDAFCDRCNVCLCDMCYEDHVTTSSQCPPQPLSVRKEASNMKMRSRTLEQEFCDFEKRISVMNEQAKRSIDELSKDCDLKCYQIWHEFEIFMEEARLKAGKLCDNLREITDKQIGKWHLSVNERDNLLEKVKIWHLNSTYLLSENTNDEDVITGLRPVKSAFSSRIYESFVPEEKAKLVMTFPSWCHDSLHKLENEMVHLMIETSTRRNLEFEKDWNVSGSNLDISSILISEEDGHVFVGDWENKCIKEFHESGEFLRKCSLSDGEKKLSPQSMCFIPDDIIVVCGEFPATEKKLFFLQRKKYHPFLEKQKAIDTKKEYYSLCQMNDMIFACDSKFNEIDCFSKNGNKINTIKPSWLSSLSNNRPLLCADPTTGYLWGTKLGMSEIFIFNIQNGEIHKKVKINNISDFCGNKFGHFYFFTKEGISSAVPQKVLYEFQKNISSPLIIVSTKKLLICFKNNDKYFMKIFKINY